MVGSGFTDENLAKVYNILKDNTIEEPLDEYHVQDIQSSKNKMDVWFSPTMVMEIKATDFLLSSLYTCGINEVEEDRGISLRFPRFMKIRDDKTCFDATPSSMILDMYNQQASVLNQNGNFEDDDDCY